VFVCHPRVSAHNAIFRKSAANMSMIMFHTLPPRGLVSVRGAADAYPDERSWARFTGKGVKWLC